jgi:hypothetical protein
MAGPSIAAAAATKIAFRPFKVTSLSLSICNSSVHSPDSW